MLNSRQRFDFIRNSGSWLRSQTRRLLSGVGVFAILPQFADAARKKDRREDDQDHKHDDSRASRDDGQDSNQNDRKSDRDTISESRDDSRDSDHKSDQSDERHRGDSRNKDDDGGNQAESEGRTSRREAKRQDADSESSERSDTSDDDGSQGGGRRTREFEQRAADEPVDDGSESAIALQTNPNVVVDDLPETSITDLVVEANENVIASVSARGGFAFARSGGVTAVTGPDGASIIQTGDTDSVTPTTPVDDEPSDDGGNNDMDFSS